MLKILLVEDDLDIRGVIEYNLVEEGVSVRVASNGVEGLEQLAIERPNIVLLDITMPVMDGIELCRRIKTNIDKDIIVIFLSARTADESQIMGLREGADAFISKPITPKLLIAKIKALINLRHPLDFVNTSESVNTTNLSNPLNSNNSWDKDLTTTVKESVLDINSKTHQVFLDKREIVFSKKEFSLLNILWSEKGRLFSRKELFLAVWGEEIIVGERTLDVHIRRIREKIGNDLIQTVKGVGFKFRE